MDGPVNPWEVDWSQARPAAPIGYIPGPPKEPSPQTAPQAEKDVLGVAEARAHLGRVPLENAQTQTSIASSQNSIRNSNISTAQGVRDDFHKQEPVKNYITVLPQFASAIHAADNQAGDMQIVYAFGKVMDPGSSVREGEQQSAANVGGVSDRVAGYLAQLQGGGRLRPAQRQALVGEIRNRALEIAAGYNQTRQQYSALAQRSGLNPEDVVGPHPGAPYQQAEADFVHRPIRNLDGSQGAVPHGYQPPRAPGTPPVDPSGEGDIGFVNQHEANALPEGAQAFQRSLQDAIQRGEVKTADQFIQYGQQHGGFNIRPDQADAAAKAIARGVMPNVATPTFEITKINDMRGKDGFKEKLDAGVRGFADVATLGFADEMAAAGDTIFNGGTMRYNLARQRGIDKYDEKNHAPSRIAGQVAGGFALPMGEVGSVGNLATKSAGYGAAYGLGSGEGNVGDRLVNALKGGVEGGVVGGAVGAGGKLLGRGVNALAPKGTEAPPLVDPVTGRLNSVLESATPAQRVGAAADLGINLPLGAATDRGGAVIEKGLDVLPPSAGVMADSRRAVAGQVDNALSNVANKYGSAESFHAGGAAAQQGARNWMSRAEQTVTRAYNAIPISDKADAALANTRATLDQLTSAFQSNPQIADAMKNSRLETYRAALERGGLSWADLKGLRSRIGYEIGEQRFSDSPTKDEMRALYSAMSEDMRATAQAQGPRALAAFERANNLNREVEGRIEGALVSILGNDSKANPEAAARAIQAIAMGGKGSANLDKLSKIRASMSKGGEWDEVASSLIRLGGQPANSAGREFNPGTFVNWYADMSEPARKLLFGDRGRADLRAALDKFVAVNQRLAGSNALRNTSNTGTGMAGMGAVGAVAGAILNPLLTVKVAALAGADFGIAKLWTNPNFVRWATGYTRMIANGADATAVKSQVGRLRQVAANSPELRDEVGALAASLVPSDNSDSQTKQNHQPNKQP